MLELGNLYPDCCFGRHFYKWIITKSRKLYGCYGNGSAIRVWAIGWVC